MLASEKTSLSPASPQFSRVEYLLQLSLRASTAKILNATVVSNPHLTLQFEKRAKDILTVDCWVDASQLGGSHSDDDLMKRLSSSAFQLPTQGMKFSVGHIPMDTLGINKKKSSSESTKMVKKMVLCKIAIGRAYVADPKSVTKETIPDGYDSFYLLNPDMQLQPTVTNEYYHEYYIKNTSQVLPQTIVTFEFDPLLEKLSREKPVCDNCEKTYASVHCAADMANLCADCDINLHATKILQRHKRTPIGKGTDAFGQCRTHSDQKIEFFCAQCHVPVCVHCKMVGHHSAGEASKHKLVSVVEAFETVMKESKTRDQVLQSRRQTIQQQTTALRQRGKQVEDLKAQLEAELERIYKKARTELHSNIQRKLIVLMSDEMELKREDQEIDSLEKFLEYQQTGCDMYHLLFNWSKHQQLRQELHEFKHFRDSIDVFLDLKVAGELSVVVDESKKREVPKPTGNRLFDQLKKDARPSSQHGDARHATAIKNPSGLRRTSDFFAETLNALDDLTLERSSFVNGVNDDERSIMTSGYEFDC